MRIPFSFAFLLACLVLVPASVAQNSPASSIEQLPNCAVKCLLTAVQQSPCTTTNQTCICTNQPLQSSVTACVTASCTVREALFTKNLTDTTCGVPIRDKTQLYTNISISFGVISAAFVLARLAFKIFATIGELGLDDYFILLTLLLGVPSSILNVRGLVANGLGRDVWTIPFSKVIAFVRIFYVMEILYFAQVALLKLSLLFFYQRIFPGVIIKRIIWATVAFDIAFGITFVIVAIFQCRPISYYWTKIDGEHQGECVNINAMGWSNAAISIVLDVWMLAIPISQLIHLKLHWKKKVGVAMMFVVGTFVTVVSILRLQSLVTFANSANPTWDQWDVGNWSTIEINVGIMCACMPAVRLILVRLFPKVLGSTSNTKQGYYNTDPSKMRSRSNTLPITCQGAPSSGLDNKSILCSKSYDVEYEDHTMLVPMRDLEAASAKTDSRDDVSRVNVQL